MASNKGELPITFLAPIRALKGKSPAIVCSPPKMNTVPWSTLSPVYKCTEPGQQTGDHYSGGAQPLVQPHHQDSSDKRRQVEPQQKCFNASSECVKGPLET